ncbi:MAG: molybdopterin-dependent oxidoreductase [Actinobacteria bacterium]|nr:molybdopterin-dependent oxidoreductase [Actinomycetota bacterium]
MSLRVRLAQLSDSDPPRWWPQFRSVLHHPAVTARVGRVLGVFFTVCFVTGLLSHYQYGPWRWLPEPASPAWGYRVTQGLHVMTGIAAIPLLLVKLWTVYPRLFAWPPARSIVTAIERLSIGLFVSAALLELFTGLFNILNWYPWPWSFVPVHYALAYVVFGSLLLHVAVKLPVIRQGLATPLRNDQRLPARGLSRRGLLLAAAAGVGTVVVTTVGQTVSPLEPLALLAPRRPSRGPLKVPINRTAAQADVVDLANSMGYRLNVAGPDAFELSVEELLALATAERELPLACVEGWSVSARWKGVRLLDLVERAGGSVRSRVLVSSLQRRGPFGNSTISGPQLSQALLATHLNGERLTLDHGYPVRLIAPDRAGVLNTKWLNEVRIL